MLETHRSLAAGKPPPAETLAALSRSLLSGIETSLAGGSRAWIAADGALHYLPFEILPLPAAGADSLSGRWISRFGLLPLPAAAKELAAAGELLGARSGLRRRRIARPGRQAPRRRSMRVGGRSFSVDTGGP